MATQNREALQSSYDEMIEANREKLGRYTAREIMTIQAQIVDLDLADLTAAAPAITEQCEAAHATMRTAQAAYNAAHQALLEAVEVANRAGFRESNHRDAVEHATKLQQSLATELSASDRGVKLVLRV